MNANPKPDDRLVSVIVPATETTSLSMHDVVVVHHGQLAILTDAGPVPGIDRGLNPYAPNGSQCLV
jgi:hypothetical protein